MTTAVNTGLSSRLREFWRRNRAEAMHRCESWQETMQRIFAGYAQEDSNIMDNKRLWKQYEDST